jgi:hypothetical protein
MARLELWLTTLAANAVEKLLRLYEQKTTATKGAGVLENHRCTISSTSWRLFLCSLSTEPPRPKNQLGLAIPIENFGNPRGSKRQASRLIDKKRTIDTDCQLK